MVVFQLDPNNANIASLAALPPVHFGPQVSVSTQVTMVGMGRDLYERFDAARGIFDAADRALGFPLTKLCFEGPEERLLQTVNTQPAIVTTSIACFAAAIVVDKHFSSAGIKAVMIAVVIIAMNAVLTHATARAARVRQFGRWISDVTEVRGIGDNSTAGLNSQPQVDATDKMP